MTEATWHASIKWITNENLLYSPRKPPQWSTVTCMGRKPNKEGMHRHTQPTHSTAQEKLAQHCKAALLQQKSKKEVTMFVDNPVKTN